MSDIMVQHMQTYYDGLKAEADRLGIFTGSMVQVYRKLGISMTHYSVIRSVLTNQGCIEIKQVGRSHQPSIVRVVRRPTEDDYHETYKKALTIQQEAATLRVDVRLEALERRVGTVDIGAAFQALSDRIEALEQKVGGTDFGTES